MKARLLTYLPLALVLSVSLLAGCAPREAEQAGPAGAVEQQTAPGAADAAAPPGVATEAATD